MKEFGEVKICLRDENHSCLEASTPMQEQMQLCYEMPEPVTLWDNHNPYLYELELEVYNQAWSIGGELCHTRLASVK